MKIIILLLGLFFTVGVFSQDMGLIEVNEDNTATLNFSDDIDVVVIGNNPMLGMNGDMPEFKNYGVFTKEKTAILRANLNTPPQTSITVRLTSGKVFFGKIKYGDNNKIFYDFSDREVRNKEQEKLKKDSVVNKNIMVERLDRMMKMAIEYQTFGARENNMQIMVSNIMNDENYTYIKVIVSNNSGSDYSIDNIMFKYTEQKNKGFLEKNKMTEERINSVYDTNVKTIKAYSKEELGYVIPLFTVGEKGNLIVQLLEDGGKGTRNPRVEIEQKDLLKVKVIQ